MAKMESGYKVRLPLADLSCSALHRQPVDLNGHCVMLSFPFGGAAKFPQRLQLIAGVPARGKFVISSFLRASIAKSRESLQGKMKNEIKSTNKVNVT